MKQHRLIEALKNIWLFRIFNWMFNKKKILCENCREELSKSEIKQGFGWCDNCNLPEGDVYA